MSIKKVAGQTYLVPALVAAVVFGLTFERIDRNVARADGAGTNPTDGWTLYDSDAPVRQGVEDVGSAYEPQSHRSAEGRRS